MTSQTLTNCSKVWVWVFMGVGVGACELHAGHGGGVPGRHKQLVKAPEDKGSSMKCTGWGVQARGRCAAAAHRPRHLRLTLVLGLRNGIARAFG